MSMRCDHWPAALLAAAEAIRTRGAPRYLEILVVMSKILVSVDDKLHARIDRAARSAGGPTHRGRLQGLFDAHRSEQDAMAAIRGDRDAR